MEFKEQMNHYRKRAEQAIAALLPGPDTPPAHLHQAMRYSMEAGGKRLRPMLAYAVFDMLEGDGLDPDPAAVALECIHTYSLIHDDLPAMDNSDLRRGIPTSHIRYDEATAILAGDALLTYAFELLAVHYRATPPLLADLVLDLSRAAGSTRLIGGQMEDILSERSGTCNETTLDYIQKNKTAALIQCSLLTGARLAGSERETLDTVKKLGLHLGLAFQLIDDVLDVSRDTESLGKPAGLDHRNDTASAIHFYGLEGARKHASRQTELALKSCRALSGDESDSFLHALIQWMETRLH